MHRRIAKSLPCRARNPCSAAWQERVLICATVFGTELIVSVTETPPPAVVRISGSNFSLRVIAGAIILLFCYYAQGVVITLLLSILLAYFLDPAVEILERVGIPRTAGAMVMVLILIAVLGAVGYGLGTRLSNFAENWPKYSTVLRGAADSVEGKINGIEGRVAPGADPGPGGNTGELRRLEPDLLRTMLTRGAGSLYAIFLEITFVPFLVFFMLAGKREVWHGTLQLFPVGRRTQVKETLEDLREVLRDYLAGMSIVTGMVIAASSLFFWIMDLDYPDPHRHRFRSAQHGSVHRSARATRV